MKKLGKAILLAWVATAVAQEKGRFEPRPVTAYPARQTVEKVTIAVEPFQDSGKIKQAFGKSDPTRYGVLPVLVVIANDSERVLQLERMRAQFITADRQIVDSVPAEDIQRTGRVKPPEISRSPSPIPGIRRGPKQPREEWEIAAREFVAPVVEAGGKAHGFLYFRVAKERIPGSKLYITGMKDARTGQDLLYFEILVDK